MRKSCFGVKRKGFKVGDLTGLKLVVFIGCKVEDLIVYSK